MSIPSIVVLGAGRSSGWLVKQLESQAISGKIKLTVLDGHHPAYSLHPVVTFTTATMGDGFDYKPALAEAFVCISLLPPPFHPAVMEACVATNTHFISASYESAAARSHAADAEAKKLLILNECGFDPGIDHVTAIAMLHRVKEWGGHVVSFESDSGGLPAVQDLNDWGYRFFWNPINVVTAGAAGARFRENGEDKLISYPEVFKQYRPMGLQDDHRDLVAYPNRDSIPYIELYELEHVQTFIRGTIRYKDYCNRWAVLAEAQVANTSITLDANTTFNAWVSLFSWHPKAHVLLTNLLAETDLGPQAIGQSGTSADVLLKVLMHCWNPGQGYKDRAIMRHRIVYELNGQHIDYRGMLDTQGTDAYTAMAFLVGLPIAVMVDSIIQNPVWGVLTPSSSALWPIIYENLPKFNVKLTYTKVPLST